MGIQIGEFLQDKGAMPCSNCGKPRTNEDIGFKTKSVGPSVAIFLCKKCKTAPYQGGNSIIRNFIH